MRPLTADDDPIVIYDVMRECATRLSAVYAQRVTVGGVDDPAIVKMCELRDEVDAVDLYDPVAQLAMSDELRRRYAAERAAR